MVDLSGNYTMTGGEELRHMIHISDWLPTFLSWAGSQDLAKDLKGNGSKQQTNWLMSNMINLFYYVRKF